MEVEEATIYGSLRKVGKRERARIPVEEIYYPGAGLVRAIYTDLRSPEQKRQGRKCSRYAVADSHLVTKQTGIVICKREQFNHEPVGRLLDQVR